MASRGVIRSLLTDLCFCNGQGGCYWHDLVEEQGYTSDVLLEMLEAKQSEVATMIEKEIEFLDEMRLQEEDVEA